MKLHNPFSKIPSLRHILILTFAGLLVSNLLLFFIILKPDSLTNIASLTRPHKTYTITETDNGFRPQFIDIKKGDTITFNSERSVPFWPASNLHPTHELYPEFDPQEPIDPHKTWRFTFNKIGAWKFHDHLSPDKTGVIYVK
jgi:plastocyanin